MSSSENVRIARNAARRVSLVGAALEGLAAEIAGLGETAGKVLTAGRKILVFGNGGSAACAQHFAAEFTGKLSLDRAPLPAIALSTDTSALTAIANDMGFSDVFERQVRALGQPGDMVIGLSTSGSSKNVISALKAAHEGGMVTVLLAGPVAHMAVDLSICVPIGETARIQEAHDCILHTIAGISERIAVRDLDDDKSTDRYPFVLSETDAASFREWMRRSGQILVTTNGVFDLFHRGHRASIRSAASFGDRLVVLVNTDESVRGLGKGANRPIRPLDDRIADLATMPEVAHVVAMPDGDPIRLLSILQPQVHCKGGDYRQKGAIEEHVVIQAGGRMEYIDLVEGYSTTAQESAISGRDAS